MIAIYSIGDAPSAGRYLEGRWGLISFAYWGTSWLRGIEKVLPKLGNLVVDSGAFTIWNGERTGKLEPGRLSLESYARWLSEEAPPHAMALSFDVIGDGRASMLNHQRLCQLLPGRNLVPIWHEGDDLDLLDSYVASSEVVALGRIEGRRSKPKALEFYDAAFNRHPDARFWALGNSTAETLEPYPFYCFDATGWQRNAAYSEKHGWPWNRCSKDTRIRAHVEAISTIAHRPDRQLGLWRAF